MTEQELKLKIIQEIQNQGFKINPHVRAPEDDKEIYREVQKKARLEQISFRKKFLLKYMNKVKVFCKDGEKIDPQRISLEIKEVKASSFEEILFRWWNLIWWSIPYQRSYGRQMRFLIWDTAHNMPFGLILLQSPVLKMKVRDKALDIPKEELDLWVRDSCKKPLKTFRLYFLKTIFKITPYFLAQCYYLMPFKSYF